MVWFGGFEDLVLQPRLTLTRQSHCVSLPKAGIAVTAPHLAESARLYHSSLPCPPFLTPPASQVHKKHHLRPYF